uniref:Uncharacterized protein n=1 Tax=Physcomitrium patens TaxID=3218 RepID=A0A2K1K3C9_PHYPA|nr:hypothetical protein PHYPA_012749 [Physcomitrium patens]
MQSNSFEDTLLYSKITSQSLRSYSDIYGFRSDIADSSFDSATAHLQRDDSAAMIRSKCGELMSAEGLLGISLSCSIHQTFEQCNSKGA